jgi:CRISPR-associated endonuclease/helicase Cas3
MDGVPTSFWGKLERGTDGTTIAWHPLADHCADVAACCKAILEGTLLRQRLAKLAGRQDFSQQQVERLSVFAALHDVGKFNQGFQNKALPNRGPTAGHVGEIINLLQSDSQEQRRLSEALSARQLLAWGEEPEVPEGLLAASICHHGRPVQPHGVANSVHWRPLGSLDPIQGVSQLVDRTRVWFPRAWRNGGELLPAAAELQHAFSGLVTLSDWLGSDRRFFAFSDAGDGDRFAVAEAAAKRALTATGLDARISRASLGTKPFSYGEVFGFEPRAAQRAMLELDVSKQERLTVLEAETGSGKTEAALGHYYRLFQDGAVDGMYFALPTRTAATQLHRRVVRAVERMFPDESRPPVVLAVPGYLGIDDASGYRLPGFQVLWTDDPDERFRFRGWAAEHPKRFLAGAVVVGTIDQVLLASLVVNHSHMRAVSLLRNLLVVDEVHASDAYMNRLLETILERHACAGGHALLMSATLGSVARTPLLSAAGAKDEVVSIKGAIEKPYPSVVHFSSKSEPTWIRLPAAEQSKTIAVSLQPAMSRPDAVACFALAAAQAGSRVLVIRNTVRDCIDTQVALEALVGVRDSHDVLFECRGVPAPHHSRFARQDRLLLDEAIEAFFGKGAALADRIAVATQTVQQSLDLDADLMITDLCPMDVLLQRLGRLHRHAGHPRPPGYEVPCLEVLVPASRDLTPLISRNGEARGGHGLGTVYEDLRVLEASWRQLEAHPELHIPTMNRALVEQTTHPEALSQLVAELPEAWHRHAEHLQGALLADRRMAVWNLCTWSVSFLDTDCQFPSGELDRRILTRLGEGDRLVSIDPPLPGPFGNPVRQLTVPARLARGVGSDEKPQNIKEVAGGFSFRFGRRSFTYDRLGLRVESARCASASIRDA